MPDYRRHAMFNYLIVLPLLYVVLYLLNLLDISIAVLVGIGFYIGTDWITPDLDTISTPTNKDRIWKLFWLPYRKFSSHRGSSHNILEGFVVRMLYFGAIAGVILYMLLTMTGMFFLVEQWKSMVVLVAVVYVLMGTFVANTGHVLLDRLT